MNAITERFGLPGFPKNLLTGKTEPSYRAAPPIDCTTAYHRFGTRPGHVDDHPSGLLFRRIYRFTFKILVVVRISMIIDLSAPQSHLFMTRNWFIFPQYSILKT